MNWPRLYGYTIASFTILCLIFPPTPPMTRIEIVVMWMSAGICFAMAALPQEKEVEK